MQYARENKNPEKTSNVYTPLKRTGRRSFASLRAEKFKINFKKSRKGVFQSKNKIYKIFNRKENIGGEKVESELLSLNVLRE